MGFRVPDMTCGRCAAHIARAIADLDPSARIEFSMGDQHVRITSQSATADELGAAIGQAGYTAAVQETAQSTESGCGCGCGLERVDLPQTPTAASPGCCG